MGKRFLTLQELQFYTYGLCDSYQEIYAKKIAHRDLKPENILIDRKGFPKINDFGYAAKSVCDDGKDILFQDMKGTAAYKSPEHKYLQSTRFSDLWALSSVIYEMMTGRSPFDKEGVDWDNDFNHYDGALE